MDQTRAQVHTGGTTNRVDGDRRTLMEAKISTAEERRAGDQDLDRDTREEEVEATGGGDTEGEGTEGTGALTRGSPVESSEDGETTGETLLSLILNVCRLTEV